MSQIVALQQVFDEGDAPARRAELFLEGLKRIALSGENDRRRSLLQECLEAYSNLEPAQKEHYQTLLNSPPYQEVKAIMMTTYERGIEQGKITGQRETALMLLEEKFGPLAPVVRQRVEALSPDELRLLLRDLLKAQSLQDLHLEE